MGVFHTAAGQNVLAEEASGEELITIVPEETEAPETAETSSEEAGSTMPEETEVTETPETAGQQTQEKASETVETETDQEVVIVPDVRETEGMEPTEVPAPETQETEEIQTEITLPGKSVVLPVSAFLPLQEEKTPLFLNAYSGLYLLHIKSDQEMTETLLFNQNLKEEDVVLYRFDAEKNGTADTEPGFRCPGVPGKRKASFTESERFFRLCSCDLSCGGLCRAWLYRNVHGRADAGNRSLRRRIGYYCDRSGAGNRAFFRAGE